MDLRVSEDTFACIMMLVFFFVVGFLAYSCDNGSSSSEDYDYSYEDYKDEVYQREQEDNRDTDVDYDLIGG